MTEPGDQIRRRIVVIKRALQMKYVLLVFAAVLLTVTIVTLDLYYIMGKVYGDRMGGDLPAVMRGSARLLAIHLPIYFAAVIVAAVFISHKFAGPLFRLEKVAEAIAGGDLTVKANLRAGDELFDTAEHINVMIETLRQKLLKEKHLSDRIAQKLSEISEKLESKSIPPEEAAQHLQDVLIEVRHIASDFKL